MVGIPLFVAFLGGALSLLPACGPALVPAFFAYAFVSRQQLVLATLLFALGFSIIFIPFGLGVRFVVDVLVLDRTLLYRSLGVLLLVWGTVILFGFGLRSLGAARHLLPREHLFLAFTWGLLFGFTSGACSAPIFGAIITLAAATETYAQASILLAVFALGMFVPLFLLAWLFKLTGKTRLPKLLGLGFKITMGKWTRTFFLRNIIVAILCIILGLSFLKLRSDWFLGSSRVTNWFLDANDRLLR